MTWGIYPYSTRRNPKEGLKDTTVFSYRHPPGRYTMARSIDKGGREGTIMLRDVSGF